MTHDADPVDAFSSPHERWKICKLSFCTAPKQQSERYTYSFKARLLLIPGLVFACLRPTSKMNNQRITGMGGKCSCWQWWTVTVMALSHHFLTEELKKGIEEWLDLFIYSFSPLCQSGFLSYDVSLMFAASSFFACFFGRDAQGLVWVELTNNLCQLTTLFLMSTLSSQM